jgi:hypothetical protein
MIIILFFNYKVANLKKSLKLQSQEVESMNVAKESAKKPMKIKT